MTDHSGEAERLLGLKAAMTHEEYMEIYAQAQAHATLALAQAVQHLADSYNGWKDLGQ